MSNLELVDAGIMYINPDPAHGTVFALHQSPCQLSAKELLCVFQRGTGLYAPDNMLGVLRSLDGGVTWTDEGFLYDGSGDARPCSYHGGMLTRMRDGVLVNMTIRVDRSRPGQKMFSDVGGIIENEPVFFLSTDGGHTWDGPRLFPLPDDLIATPACSIVELEDGAWLATFDRWFGYDEPKAYKPLMLAFRSPDGGGSWDEPVVMADGEPEGKGYWHGKTIQLADGRLYTLYWTADMTDPDKGPQGIALHCATADGRGREWTRPKPTNLVGQTNWPGSLPRLPIRRSTRPVSGFSTSTLPPCISPTKSSPSRQAASQGVAPFGTDSVRIGRSSGPNTKIFPALASATYFLPAVSTLMLIGPSRRHGAFRPNVRNRLSLKSKITAFRPPRSQTYNLPPERAIP